MDAHARILELQKQIYTMKVAPQHAINLQTAKHSIDDSVRDIENPDDFFVLDTPEQVVAKAEAFVQQFAAKFQIGVETPEIDLTEAEQEVATIEGEIEAFYAQRGITGKRLDYITIPVDERTPLWEMTTRLHIARERLQTARVLSA